jgi:hypothetical protein
MALAKFLYLLVGLEHDVDDQSEESQAYSAKWVDWMADLAKDGTLDGGLPLKWSGKVVSSDKVEDVELEEVDIGGYLVVNADSLEKATEIARGAPNVELGGSVIVRPCEEIPG